MEIVITLKGLYNKSKSYFNFSCRDSRYYAFQKSLIKSLLKFQEVLTDQVFFNE